MKRIGRLLIVSLSLALGLACTTPSSTSTSSEALKAASVGPHRSPQNIARNKYRHPVETLEFFGLEEDMTVLEALPGGLWYGEIIAPFVRDQGEYIAAVYDVSLPGRPDYQIRQVEVMETRFAGEPEVFGTPRVATLSPPDSIDLGEPGSVDIVLTFRNLHGWVRDGVEDEVLAAFFEVLKPGGVLGIVQHRAGPRSDPDPDAFIGYLAEDRVISMAEAAGFVLEARSEINANPDDTADHPRGVWTLPPSFALGEKDRAKYAAIGESDRMTLRFRKPADA
jgi:predicted methyltransferase